MSAHVAQALAVFYGKFDSAQKKEAEIFLTNWQQQVEAWQICDQILCSDAEVEGYVSFFAAQTYRTKIQYDFYQLPTESYNNIKASLITHIQKFSKINAVLQQLCLAIADLSVQLGKQWPTAVSDIVETFNTPNTSHVLILLLQFLAEENENTKVMAEPGCRHSHHEILNSAAPHVLTHMSTIQPTTVDERVTILECFKAWLRIFRQPPPLTDPVIQMALKIIESSDDIEEIENAVDVVYQVIRSSHSAPPLDDEGKTVALLDFVIQTLKPRIECLVSSSDCECQILQQIARLSTDVGCILAPKISISSPLIDERIGIFIDHLINLTATTATKINELTNQDIVQIQSLTLSFWFKLTKSLCRNKNPKIADFFPYLYKIIAICLEKARATDSCEQWPDSVHDMRENMRELAQYCNKILPPNDAMEKIVESLKMQRTPVEKEAHLWILLDFLRGSNPQPQSALWDVLDGLPSLIICDTSQIPSPWLHLAIRQRAASVIGYAGHWIKQNPVVLKACMNVLLTLLTSPMEGISLQSDVPLTRQFRRLQAVTAGSYRDICQDARDCLSADVGSLIQAIDATADSMECRDHVHIVEAAAYVVRDLKDINHYRQALEKLGSRLAERLQTSSQRGNPRELSDEFDRIASLFMHSSYRGLEQIPADVDAREELLVHLQQLDIYVYII
eukprot:GHVL01001105.1.p1 GENE.GHVL01001105.1~~GHVL01001105.1.p1  ORF type:complete len:678 (-),score=139.04 GHVL01001105.1:301-2334(-)